MNKNIKSFLRLIDELRFMAGGYQRYFALMVILFLANAAVEVVGLGMIGAYASLLISPTSHNDLTILPGWLRELFFGMSSHDRIILVGQALVFLFFLKAMMLIGINALITLIVGKIGIHIKMRAVASYIHLPYLAYTRRPGSHYIVASDTYSVQAASSIKSLLKLLSEGTLAVGLLSLLITANALAVFLLTGLIGLALLAYDRSFRRRMFHYGKRINENRKIAVQALQEGLLGLKEIRILGREEFFTNRVKSSMDKVVHSQVKDKVIRVLPEAGLQLLLIVAIVATVSLAFETQEEIFETLPIIGLFALAGLRLVPVGVNTGVAVSQLRSARHAVNELYLDLTKSGYGNQDSPGAVGGHGLNQDCEALVKEFKSLKIVNLTFSYPGSGKSTLEDINFEVSRGESVGLMGASGVGKSTLLDIVLGLIPPDRGIIEVNGVDIRKVKKCWQQLVAYIPQEVFLVNGTVRENVALGEGAEAVDEASGDYCAYAP